MRDRVGYTGFMPTFRFASLFLPLSVACLMLMGVFADSAVLQRDNGGIPKLGDTAERAERSSEARSATVLWISIDGVRPDYIDRGTTPVFDRLMREGAYSRDLVPVFPSLTFPSHVSLATGVKVREHGIPGNSFIDIERERTYRYPPWADMLGAEPIWLTATRQNVRVAVYDWPVSHSQRGEVTSEYFGQRYEGRLTDRERITVLMDAWEKDSDEKRPNAPLRLLMGYVVEPDSAGHQYGPDAKEPVERLEETDTLLGEVIEKAVSLWERDKKRFAGDDGGTGELWVILTTDHGMSPVHTLVHLGYLAELQGIDDVETVTSGNVGHLFFRGRDTPQNDGERVRAMVETIDAHPFARAWRRDDLPDQWQYDHPTRTGDIVVVLDTGYTFSSRPQGVTGEAKELGGPLGMHGYDPRTNEQMNGFMAIWRHPEPIGGVDLGRVHALQLHPSIAKLLGIEPAEKATAVPIDFESVQTSEE